MQGKVYIGDSRNMHEIGDETVDLAVTSPPYWHIKDYGVPGQIGYGQSLHEYLRGLYAVWSECRRVLRPGARLCINVGDQFARAVVYGRYKIIAIHAEFIAQCERIGFDFLGSIIWQKKTTMNTTGGAAVMGSYPYPPNGIVELDYEFILLFKKPGKSKTVSEEIKKGSVLTKEEWKEYFLGHWYFGGTKQTGHEAMFPPELPRRLIRMFSFAGDAVLDPFLGSGTTMQAALELNRNAIGYEINEEYLKRILEKTGAREDLFGSCHEVRVEKLEPRDFVPPPSDYVPGIPDAYPQRDPGEYAAKEETYYRVAEVPDAETLRLENGLAVRFLGVRVEKTEETLTYLRKRIRGKRVFLKSGDGKRFDAEKAGGTADVYVYLKNRIFVNKHLIQAGLGSPDPGGNHKWKERFARLGEETKR